MKFDTENVAILVCFLTSFFGVFLSNGVVVGVPVIGAEFGMTNVVQNWITTIFFLACAVFTVPAGQISGKYGVKKSLIIGTIVFLLGSICACLSFSTVPFMIFGVVQGIGLALVNVSGTAMVVQAVSPKNRGKALGLTVTGVYLATSFSPVISGSLTYYFSWRAIFAFVIPFLVICIILMFLKIPGEWKTFAGDSIDKVGSIIYSIGILAFIYGFTSLITFPGKISLIIGIILIIIFAVYELKQKTPVFNVNLFKNTKFSSSNVAALCSYLAIMAITTILNYHFQYVRGWNTQMVGLVLIATPIVMAIVAPNAGKLSDKIHPQKLAAIGMTIAAIAIFILSFLDANTPLYVVIIAMILQGLGMGLYSSPNMNAIMSSVPPKFAPTASASQATMRTIGQTMSLGMLTLVFAWVLGNAAMSTGLAAQIVQGSQSICFVCGCLCVLAIFASLVGIKSKAKFNTE